MLFQPLIGTLSVIDRKKNLFKLSQGEYIRPEFIEGVYKQCKSIANIYVHGESTENYLVAIVIPDFEVLGIKGVEAQKKAIKDEKLFKKIQHEMEHIAVQEKLRGFEFVKKFILDGDDFSVENGMLTPTFKLKRNEAKKKYGRLIKELYSQDQPTEPVKIASKL